MTVPGCRRLERDPGHPVDRGAQLLVGDAHELALDDDVADGEQAAAVHPAEGAKVKSAAASISTARIPRFDHRSY